MRKRTISKSEYEKNRALGDQACAKERARIAADQGKEAVKGKHVDHLKPIAHGGSPTSRENMKLVSAKKNVSKGSRTAPPKKAVAAARPEAKRRSRAGAKPSK